MFQVIKLKMAARKKSEPELSELSFDQLRKLGEKLGYKTYKEAAFGPKSTDITKTSRKNKNKPREESSKKKPIEVKKEKKPIARDPRFDSLYGTYNEEHFKKAYSFIPKIRKKEKKELKRRSLIETDEEEKKRIKYLISRIESQEREEIKKEKKKRKEKQETEARIQALESGHKPHFKTKYERKLVNLVDRFTELKKSGKLKKHMKKVEKKDKKIIRTVMKGNEV